ncbi:nucleotidyltransferase domain-containing protein [Halobacillus sp. Nhm2S1]|uniref:nucleotidyltransferase domain-containing protein n=1 Tax=Halobacillus sp. Nhm2S1 TaxID=2866716 RepID=UPI001C734214|nr:nucleotidyltransferase domain-containing protein [Halobacillus sp. Nhm2S1]MBX0359279.1 nucleotidyltransferase domain-containing protein [Halobacillus sp. Nhm2S1]
MRQREAVEKITGSLKEDDLVKAVFLKGSMGRGEEDEHSDVDLYVLVDEVDKGAFLKNRQKHLESYQHIIFYDDIFIIAPQIIAVYENLLHVDLFTVTEETFVHKDFFRVLYDPEQRMVKHEPHQNLYLSDKDFLYAVDDIAFFFLQYKKAADRGNDMWAVKVANDIGVNVAKVLLQKYAPDQAQLGLKAVPNALPSFYVQEMENVYRSISLDRHEKAVVLMAAMMEDHLEWLEDYWGSEAYTIPFLKRMIKEMKNRTP